MSRHMVIVGGTSGAGRAYAKRVIGRGEKVVILGRRDPETAFRDKPNVIYIQADLGDLQQIQAATAKIQNQTNALSSVVFFQRYRGPEDRWQGEIDVTLTATKELIEGLVPHFHAEAGGAIVVVGSNAATFVADEQPVGYHVMKAGLVQMVRYYAYVLGPKNIRVNGVSPASTVKNENRDFYAANRKLTDLYAGITPLRRMGTTDDVGNAIDFLIGDSSSFITGIDLLIDGGVSLGAQMSLARNISELSNLSVTRKD